MNFKDKLSMYYFLSIKEKIPLISMIKFHFNLLYFIETLKFNRSLFD
jgi:hypothetical protein